MLRAAIWIGLCVPALATAASPGWYADGAYEVVVDGTSTVPLYRGQDGRAFVLGDLGGQKVPTYLGLYGENTVTSEVVEALELKVRDGAVSVPTLQIGDVTVRSVHAKVGPEVSLDLNTLPDLAVAVRPSAGEVTLAPAADGDAVLALVGEAVEGRVEGKGTWWYHGVKKEADRLSLWVPGTFAGQVGVFALDPSRAASSLGGEVDPGAAVERGGVRYARGSAEVGGAPLPASWWMQDQSLVGRDGDRLGVLGADVLYAVDWAAAGGRIAVAAAGGDATADPAEALIQAARDAFAASEAEAEAEDAEKAGDTDEEAADQGDPAAAARHGALADVLWEQGAHDEALEHYRSAVGAAPEQCAPLLSLGRALREAGQPGEALPSLLEATSLWDRWYGQDLEVRQHAPPSAAQDPACHLAPGELAAARWALGSLEAVHAVAASHREFDRAPWVLSGVAHLAQGDALAASASLRQAALVPAPGRPGAWLRASLGWANAGLGRPEAVQAQIDAIRTQPEPLDLVTAFAVVRLAERSLGAGEAAPAARSLTEADPLSAPAWLALAIARRLGGGTGADALVEAADRAAAAQARRPLSDDPVAWAAAARALSGDAAGARETLEAREGASSADHFFALALVRHLDGDDTASAEALTALLTRYPATPLPITWAEPGWAEAP